MNEKDREKRRKAHNAALLERMKDGTDSLSSFDASLSWFPPRPLIKKDTKELARLYGKKDGSK